jgi:thiaminase/transcriptional activator TenA
MEKFRYYLLQDYNYLVNFAKALSMAAAKAPTVQLMKEALALAYGTVTGEMANYEALIKEVGLTLEDAERAEPNFVNVSYMSYLLSVCSLEGFYQCMAATLPCFGATRRLRNAAETPSSATRSQCIGSGPPSTSQTTTSAS